MLGISVIGLVITIFKTNIKIKKANSFDEMLAVYKNYADRNLTDHFIDNPFVAEEDGDDKDIDDVCDECQELIGLINRYKLKIKPTSDIINLSLFLKQVYASGIFKKGRWRVDYKGFNDLTKQIKQIIITLDNDYEVLLSKAHSQVQEIQKLRKAKNIANGNIEALSEAEQMQYFANLAHKLNNKDKAKQQLDAAIWLVFLRSLIGKKYQIGQARPFSYLVNVRKIRRLMMDNTVFKATICYDVDKSHPDIRYIDDPDKWQEISDRYRFSYLEWGDDVEGMIAYMKNDLALIAGGGYNTDHIHKVTYKIVKID